MPTPKMLSAKALDRITDTVPNLRDRMQLVVHNIAVRQALEDLEEAAKAGSGQGGEGAVDLGAAVEAIADWMESEMDGREKTVRGKAVLQMVERLRAGEFKAL